MTQRYLTEQISDADALTIAALLEIHAKPGMVAVELGTYTGRSAITMLEVLAKIGGHPHLFCVDWFRGNVGVEAEIGPSYREHDVLAVLRGNLDKSGHGDFVTVILGKTSDAVRAFADGGIDALFVDADHRYSAVQADLDAWLPKVRAGGLVFGHDFEKHLRECDLQLVAKHCEEDFAHGCHFGVIRAVSERFPNVERDGRVWFAIKGGTT